jgi:hypothetical protein
MIGEISYANQLEVRLQQQKVVVDTARRALLEEGRPVSMSHQHPVGGAITSSTKTSRIDDCRTSVLSRRTGPRHLPERMLRQMRHPHRHLAG